jgi:hypothetical protein
MLDVRKIGRKGKCMDRQKIITPILTLSILYMISSLKEMALLVLNYLVFDKINERNVLSLSTAKEHFNYKLSLK